MHRYMPVVLVTILCIVGFSAANADIIHIPANTTLPYACTQSNSTYILDADLVAPKTAIVIAAEYVKLDLNGHTITYGTDNTSSNAGLALYCGYYNTTKYPNLPNPSPLGWKRAKYIEVSNGSIIQGGSGDNCDCIRAVENTDINIHDLTIYYKGNSTKGINLFEPRTPINISRVDSSSDTTTISSRHQGYPQIDISGYYKGNISNTINVNNCTLHRGCHLGIRVSCKVSDPGKQDVTTIINGNKILGTQSRYANDYAIQFMGFTADIYDNIIDNAPDGPTPGFGRGLHINGAQNCRVYNNIIKIRERPNEEYSSYFTHGIKLESDIQFGYVNNNDIHHNDITIYQYYNVATNTSHGGYGLNLAEYANEQPVVAGLRNIFHDNTVTAKATKKEVFKERDVGCVGLLNIPEGSCSIFRDNTFNTDQHVVVTQGYEVQDVSFYHNIINKTSSGDMDWQLMVFFPYGFLQKGIKFIDNIYQNEAIANSSYLGINDPGSDYSVGWFVDPIVKNSAGSPVQGATITIKDSNGAVVYNGTTNAEGIPVTRPEILQKTITHSGAATVLPTVVSHTPHTIVVSKSGFTTYQSSVNVNSSQTLNIALEGTISAAITNVRVTNIKEDSATILWDTSHPATSVVDYGPTTTYGSTTAVPTLVSSHSVTLTALSPQTQYHYKVSSVIGEDIISGTDQVFTTDTIYPKVVSARSLGLRYLIVHFDRELKSATVTPIANYSLSPKERVTGAVLLSDNKSVKLITSTLSAESPYTITCIGVADLTGHAIPSTGAISNSASFVANGPFISVVMSTSPSSAKPGDVITCTILATNEGNAVSTSTLIETPLDPNIEYVPNSSTCNGGPITPTIRLNRLVTNVGQLKAGSSVTIIHKMKVK